MGISFLGVEQMNVGELFISLGIKGADKTVGALKSVKGYSQRYW